MKIAEEDEEENNRKTHALYISLSIISLIWIPRPWIRTKASQKESKEKGQEFKRPTLTT